MNAKLVPVVATVSAKGLMHLPKVVREGLGLKEDEKVVFFVNEDRRLAFMVPESDAFSPPVKRRPNLDGARTEPIPLAGGPRLLRRRMTSDSGCRA
jgi:AbrB family looped-hinge helix DNA binding protein